MTRADHRAGAPDDEDALISINYTSGTTGRPKGVMCTHRGSHLNALGDVLDNGLADGTVYLWTLPMFHGNGWCFTWAVTAVGGTHVCLRAPDPARIWELLEAEHVTHMCSAPTVQIGVAHHAAARPLARTVTVAMGGAPPSPTLLARLRELGFHPIHLYGLTETYTPLTSCVEQPGWSALDEDARSRLLARQGHSHLLADPVRVVDAQMDDVPRDGATLGEVVARGNTVMRGYYEDPEATEEAFRGGWFHTGDLAVWHPDGYIELRDRIKDVVISGGENISTIEVEQVVCRHPAVLECAVVAIPDDRWGERPKAFVALKDGAETSAEEIIDFCRAHLAHFKCPAAVAFGELPKTSTGKVQKFVLREARVGWTRAPRQLTAAGRDAAVNPGAVAAFLAARLPELGGPFTIARLGEGQSCLTYLVSGTGWEVVLRRPPRGELPRGAFDVVREHRVLSALADAETGVPVPRPLALCEDPEVLGAPFYLMERVHGHSVRTTLPPALAGHADRRRMGEALVDLLVALRAIDVSAVGLEGHGRPDGYLTRQLRRMGEQREAVRGRALPELDAVGAWLAEHVPDSPAPALLHGDLKLDNVILAPSSPARVAAVIDWELSTLGDPLADLGWLLYFWREQGEEPFPIPVANVTHLPGFSRRAELRDRYERLTGAPRVRRALVRGARRLEDRRDHGGVVPALPGRKRRPPDLRGAGGGRGAPGAAGARVRRGRAHDLTGLIRRRRSAGAPGEAVEGRLGPAHRPEKERDGLATMASDLGRGDFGMGSGVSGRRPGRGGPRAEHS